MTKLVRIAMLTLALVAMLGGALGSGGTAEAGGGYEQWTGPYSDGCYYFWDGYGYTMGGCPRADGGFDFYVPSNGQWAYYFSTGYLADGTVWTYYNGQYSYSGASSSGGYTTGPMIIGGSSFNDAIDVGYTSGPMIIGGGVYSDSSGYGSAGHNHDVITNILSPNCVEVVAGVCYTW